MMPYPIQLTFRNMAESPSLDAILLKHAGVLENYFPHITTCRVVLKLLTNRLGDRRQRICRHEAAAP